MAEPLIKFLLENLKQFLLYNGHLIKDAEAQADFLNEDLMLFKAKLEDSTNSWEQDAELKVLVRQMRSAVYKMEDAIDESVAKRGRIIKSQHFLAKTCRFIYILPGLINVAKKVKDLRETVKTIHNRRQNINADGEILHRTRNPAGAIGEDIMIGFEEDKNIICNYLREETDELDVMSIVGMPGVGKTKVARKIFNDMKKEAKEGSEGKEDLFSIAIMVDLSPDDYRSEVVLRGMLDEFPDDVVSTATRRKAKEMEKEKKSKGLARMVKTHLSKSSSFLVVLDNVWHPMVWNDLKDAFPEKHKAGKILITTQNGEVSASASSNPTRVPHKLPFLTFSKSCDLLKLAAFGNERAECPTNLEPLLQDIASKCGGLPHLIVIIGDYLRTKAGRGGVAQKYDTWLNVSNDLTATCLNVEDDTTRSHIFSNYSLCYHSLPYNLRPCFLYLGIFPQDYKIPVGMLLRLWIAEGFIPEKQGSTLEETALEYLNDLITWNLVIVDNKSPDGSAKKCHLHLMMRQFCKVEASIQRENFFHELTMPHSTEQALADRRRIALDSTVANFLSTKPSGPQVRSFLCFTEEQEKVRLGDDHISSIPAAFKLLRVFAAEHIQFNKLPTNEWIKLVHLRYVVLSIDSKVIPKDISSLWNMQTFIVYTRSPALDIRANIWKMEKLRHVKTNVPTKLPSATKGKEGRNLHTLGTILEGSCTKDVFERAGKLKKLGIHGQLNELFKRNILQILSKLEKLKLVQDSSITPTTTSGVIPLRLPQTTYLPECLKRLTLCRTRFPWEDMSILGKLRSLVELKLKENAFSGSTWEADDCDFNKLLVLHIEDTDLHIWSLPENSRGFRSLNCLTLWNCRKLEKLPLAQMKSLQILNLKGFKKSVTEITKDCGWSKKQNNEETEENGHEFCRGGALHEGR